MSSPDPYCGVRCPGPVCGGERLCADGIVGNELAITCDEHLLCRECAADNACRDCSDARQAAVA